MDIVFRELSNSTCDIYKGWRMVLQKLWVSQNFSRISRVSQSRFLYEGVLESRFFAMFKGLEVPIRWLVFF